MKIKKKTIFSILWALVFVGPTVGALYIFTIYPIIRSFYISFTNWDHLNPVRFIGWANYIRLFQDPLIAREIFNTLFFVVTCVPLIMITSLTLANALNKRTALTGFFRTVFFLPWVVLPIVIAIVWLIMFNTRYGFINIVLGMMNMPQPAWLANEWSVRLVIVFVYIWGALGYFSIIILSGLQNIPEQYYEACELDGGGRFWKFFKITMPLVTPQLFFIAIIGAIWLFQMFDYIFVFGRTNIFIRDSVRNMAYGIYERGFTFMEMGYASAQAVIFCLMILTITIIQNIGQKRWVHYG